MLKIKPVWISVLTVVVFVGVLMAGMTTDWWQTSGRRTPLDAWGSSGNGGGNGRGGSGESEDHDESEEGFFLEGVDEEQEDAEAHEESEDHETGIISGNSTVQSALDLGIPMAVIEDVLEGPIHDSSVSIKALAQERGLQFGVVKDMLNAKLGQ